MEDFGLYLQGSRKFMAHVNTKFSEKELFSKLKRLHLSSYNRLFPRQKRALNEKERLQQQNKL